MYLVIRRRTAAAILAAGIAAACFYFYQASAAEARVTWVDFTPTAQAMRDALKAEARSWEQGSEPVGWIDLLAVLGVKYGGDFSRYQKKDLEQAEQRMKEGKSPEEIAGSEKYFAYYRTAYGGALENLAGSWVRKTPGKSGETVEAGWGMTGFSPIAKGFSYSHYDDFGAGRSFGFRRKHEGNDLMTDVGTPVVAVEGGKVEAAGWNRYGGWRIGIRSHDGKRYWYYAHLRKGHPFAPGIQEGAEVEAGQVIGYVGMTGYSSKEDVNGMQKPHLHFGLRLIFDEEHEKAEIWVDAYHLVEFLSANRSPVARTADGKDWERTSFLIPGD